MEDSYGEVINSPATFGAIALALKMKENVMVGWTDEGGSHLDILFTYKAMKFGKHIQGGLSPEKDLFVSIMRVGAWGFAINDTVIYPSYLEEKFRCSFCSFGEPTGEKLAKLINGVKKELL